MLGGRYEREGGSVSLPLLSSLPKRGRYRRGRSKMMNIKEKVGKVG
jgi:hypothetical protein